MKILVLIPPNRLVKNIVRDLVYGCWCGGKRIGGTQMPPLNLLYTATILKNEGHKVEFIDAGIDYQRYKEIESRAKDIDAIITLLSTNSFKNDLETLNILKQINPDVINIVFGSHPTFMPKYCLEDESVDIIIRREPEFIIKDLINALEKNKNWKEVKGIGYRERGDIILNEYYPFIENLDELPIPDRSFLPKDKDYFNPIVKRMPYTTMQTSRGCPARCNFCTVPSFYGKQIRYRSADKVIDEIIMLKEMGYREIFFRDETFTVYKERNKKICQYLIDNKIGISWICNARVNTVDKEMIKTMKRAGCHMIKFGVESGNQNILNNIKKDITLGQTQKAFKICKEAGVDTHAHIMLGCPGETIQTIKNTIQFVKKIDPTTASFGIHTPYPGTELFEKVVNLHPEIKDGSEAGMEKLHIKGFFNENFTGLEKDKLEQYVKKAYRAFYFRPNYILKRIARIKDLNELMRWIFAGLNIFSFGVDKTKGQ